jgi:hypothetical protein
VVELFQLLRAEIEEEEKNKKINKSLREFFDYFAHNYVAIG